MARLFAFIFSCSRYPVLVEDDKTLLELFFEAWALFFGIPGRLLFMYCEYEVVREDERTYEACCCCRSMFQFTRKDGRRYIISSLARRVQRGFRSDVSSSHYDEPSPFDDLDSAFGMGRGNSGSDVDTYHGE